MIELNRNIYDNIINKYVVVARINKKSLLLFFLIMIRNNNNNNNNKEITRCMIRTTKILVKTNKKVMKKCKTKSNTKFHYAIFHLGN